MAKSGSLRLRRSACEGFGERRRGASGASPGAAARGRRLEGLLLDSCLDAADSPRRRAPSLTRSGFPVAYSLKLERSGGPPPFRLLVEPGGLARDVPAQVRCARWAAARALASLGWGRAAAALDAALAPLLDVANAEMRRWWGGIWIGFSVGAGAPDLRLYVNLRHGDVGSRWRRFEAVGEALGVRGLAPVARRAAPHGAPTGVCLALAGGRVGGLRLYLELARPSADAAAAACPRGFAAGAVARFAADFEARFGLVPAGTCVAFDLRADGGLERFKVEICCEGLRGPSPSEPLAWLGEQVGDWRSATAIPRFAEDMTSAFGGLTVQYVTLGVSVAPDHATAYCAPEEALDQWP